MRRLICIFLLLLLPLHSFAMQGEWPPSGNVFDLAHEVDHLEGTSHHHMADGSVHYDDSGESAQHHAEHSASCHPIALPSLVALQVALTSRTVSRTEFREYIPERMPEQPHRPPQVHG